VDFAMIGQGSGKRCDGSCHRNPPSPVLQGSPDHFSHTAALSPPTRFLECCLGLQEDSSRPRVWQNNGRGTLPDWRAAAVASH